MSEYRTEGDCWKEVSQSFSRITKLLSELNSFWLDRTKVIREEEEK